MLRFGKKMPYNFFFILLNIKNISKNDPDPVFWWSPRSGFLKPDPRICIRIQIPKKLTGSATLIKIQLLIHNPFQITKIVKEILKLLPELFLPVDRQFQPGFQTLQQVELNPRNYRFERWYLIHISKDPSQPKKYVIY